jgi:hypothetical protein
MTPKLGANVGFTNPGDVTIKGNLAVNGTLTAGVSATAATISHDLDVAAGYDIKCEAGDSVLDMSAGTGITKTTTGVNTLSGDTTVIAGKKFTHGARFSRQLAKTANWTILDTDNDVVVTGVCGATTTITLPTLADNQGRQISIILGSTPGNNVVVDGEGAETINGATTLTNASQYSVLRLFAAPAEWLVISRVGTWT